MIEGGEDPLFIARRLINCASEDIGLSLSVCMSLSLPLSQGCPQDVKSQDRGETETVNLQDRDETETFHFFQLSRLRRDRDVEPLSLIHI